MGLVIIVKNLIKRSVYYKFSQLDSCAWPIKMKNLQNNKSPENHQNLKSFKNTKPILHTHTHMGFISSDFYLDFTSHWCVSLVEIFGGWFWGGFPFH